MLSRAYLRANTCVGPLQRSLRPYGCLSLGSMQTRGFANKGFPRINQASNLMSKTPRTLSRPPPKKIKEAVNTSVFLCFQIYFLRILNSI